jgi:hypothetical protein
MRRWLITLSVFIASLAVSAVVGFYIAVVLVGPHSDLLPEPMRVPVGLLVWAGVLGVPAWLARKAYRASGPRSRR